MLFRSAGKPEGAVEPLGGFESWAKIVGGILAHAGIPDFLQNLDRFYEESDPAQLEWEALLLAIRESFDNRGFTIKELVELLPERSELRQALPDDMADEDRKGSLQRRLGRAFSERVGRRYGEKGLHLIKSGTNRNKVVLWRVQPKGLRP